MVLVWWNIYSEILLQKQYNIFSKPWFLYYDSMLVAVYHEACIFKAKYANSFLISFM